MTEARNLSALAEACESWQGGRDTGSSLLRGAARNITGLPHYFDASFITDHETAAAANPAATRRATVLLAALAIAPHRSADEWCAEGTLPASGFAGRGLGAKPIEDEQIAATLRTGKITMPLWGVSLSPGIANEFGAGNLRWIFQIIGPFPAIPAWTHSGIKADEQELICGGRYRVHNMTEEGTCTRVALTYEGPARHDI